eukprot:scaffold6446_cov50-Phaeocystis_antarctica.AAC.1
MRHGAHAAHRHAHGHATYCPLPPAHCQPTAHCPLPTTLRSTSSSTYTTLRAPTDPSAGTSPRSPPALTLNPNLRPEHDP